MRRPGSTPPDLPGYTFVRPLGSGGFSDVFLYEQQLPKRRVAVKVLLTEELTGATRAAFTAEANLMAQLSAHPYIATIYQAGVASDDRPFFVMEYCSGPSLAERYKSEVFDVADALRTGVRLSSAVATAHAAGILHRDIKPANVLTNNFGWPALTDFGISSALDEEALPVQTGTLADALADSVNGSTESASVGMSVPWSPPEMFEDDPRPDIRSDVFSLAATLYTVLAGHTPFEVRGRSNGTLDLIGRIERGAVTPIDRTDLPRSLLAVLNKGMAPDREQRFATAVDFARALQRVELELGYASTTIDVPNLQIHAPERTVGADDAAETRVRSVATIEAQAAIPSPVVPDAGAAETIVRGATRIEAQPAANGTVSERTIVRRKVTPSPTVEEPPADATATPVERPAPADQVDARPAKRRLLIGSGAAALAIVAAIVAANLLLGSAPQGEPEATAGAAPSGEPAVVDVIPTPVLDSIQEQGSDVVFAISNPDAADGDRFVWRRTDRTASDPRVSSDDGRIVVAGYFAGQTVCIEASIVRAGRQSANPLETCYPQ